MSDIMKLVDRAYEQGLTAAQAAEGTGLSPDIIRAAAREAGKPLRRADQKYAGPEIALVRALAAEGMTRSEISRETGISKPSVSRIAERHHILIRYGKGWDK